MTVIDYDNEPTFAQRYLGDGLREFNSRLASQLEQTTQVAIQRQNRINELDAYAQQLEQRIAALEQAGWDVLPTLELYWKGERPIPEWHATGTLRRVLEEGNE